MHGGVLVPWHKLPLFSFRATPGAAIADGFHCLLWHESDFFNPILFIFENITAFVHETHTLPNAINAVLHMLVAPGGYLSSCCLVCPCWPLTPDIIFHRAPAQWIFSLFFFSLTLKKWVCRCWHPSRSAAVSYWVTQSSPSGTNNHVHHVQSHFKSSFFPFLMLASNFSKSFFATSTCLTALSCCQSR